MSWNYTKLSKLATFKNGLNFSKDNWGKGLKVIGVSDFQDYIYPLYDELEEINPHGVAKESDYLEENDILFVRSNGNRDLIGRSLFIQNLKEKVSHSGFTIRLRFSTQEAYPKFYLYLFRSDLIRATLSIYGGGTNINNLNQGILSRLVVPFPPLETQKKIAAILSAYDDLIEINKQRIALLEKMAEEIYREWFVRFRFPGWQNTEFEKGIPKGWENRRFDTLCEFVKGKNPQILEDEQKKDYFIYINVDSLTGGNIVYSSKEKNSVMCDVGDVLMLMDGSRSGLTFRADKAGILGSTLALIKTKEEMKNYLYEYLKAMKEEIIFNNTGSAIPHANKEFLKRMILCLPKEQFLLNKFNEIYYSKYQQIQNLRLVNTNLEKTKNSLLPRLISGKLSVENLDIEFPPSMQ